MSKELEGASQVLVDSSATVTIRMEGGAALAQDQVEAAIKSGKESWPIGTFEQVERSKAVSAYRIRYSGGT